MKLIVEEEVFVDKGEPDDEGNCDFFCSGVLYTFRLGDREMVARKYDDEPDSASFLREGESLFKAIPYGDEMFRLAVHHLLDEGVEEVQVLVASADPPYEPVELVKVF